MAETLLQRVDRESKERTRREVKERRMSDLAAAKQIREDYMRERAAAPAWMQNDDDYSAGDTGQQDIILVIAQILYVVFLALACAVLIYINLMPFA